MFVFSYCSIGFANVFFHVSRESDADYIVIGGDRFIAKCITPSMRPFCGVLHRYYHFAVVAVCVVFFCCDCNLFL